jgi:hypothetical protein
MEVHFPQDVRAKLEQMARESGRRSDELLEDAVISLQEARPDAPEASERI